jgi:hypothetical protein
VNVCVACASGISEQPTSKFKPTPLASIPLHAACGSSTLPVQEKAEAEQPIRTLTKFTSVYTLSIGISIIEKKKTDIMME